VLFNYAIFTAVSLVRGTERDERIIICHDREGWRGIFMIYFRVLLQHLHVTDIVTDMKQRMKWVPLKMYVVL
jgi:hypothetical protein